MFNVNEYFDGRVKSIGFDSADGKATIGVMAVGEYEFGTATKEYMSITSGYLDVLLPEATEWKRYTKGETFIVEKDQKFKVKTDVETAYLCIYE